jgi:hypothetical protein
MNDQIDKLKEKACLELSLKAKKRETCIFFCKMAREEFREKKSNGVYSTFFYELVFYHKELNALQTAYSVWKPVFAEWIQNYGFEVQRDNLDEEVDSMINNVFEKMFISVLNGKLKSFSPGAVHNYMKKSLINAIYDKFRKVKRNIISILNEKRILLDEDDCGTLKEYILPVVSRERGEPESTLFSLYVIDKMKVTGILRSGELDWFLQDKPYPAKTLHNSNQTMLWNVYKIMKRESMKDGDHGKLNMILNKWPGDISIFLRDFSNM